MASSPPPQKNRNWIWFFVLMFILAITATVVLVVFNLSQQLKPEQLEAARKLWQEKGPANYTLSYAIRRNDLPDSDRYEVVVRAGKVVASKYNGQPEDPNLFPYRGMDALFNFMEKFMMMDTVKNAPKTYVRAIFDDKKTGGLQWYVRRVMGGRQREEITIETFTIDGP